MRSTPTTPASSSKARRSRATAGSDLARIYVYPHPDAVLRRTTPYLLDGQNKPISLNLASQGTAIVAALDVLLGV